MKQHLPHKGIVPPQTSGMQSSAEAHKDCNSREEAMYTYLLAKKRLLDINNWHHFAGLEKAIFTLTDASGHPKTELLPEMGDLIRIELGGQKYDWVLIEEYLETIDRRKDNDLFAFRVRPVKAPGSEDPAPAHFFSDEATSTFLIQRAKTKVTSAEKGRNEKPNLETEKFLDKVRNLVIGTGASLGFSHIQWQALMSGILEDQ